MHPIFKGFAFGLAAMMLMMLLAGCNTPQNNEAIATNEPKPTPTAAPIEPVDEIAEALKKNPSTVIFKTVPGFYAGETLEIELVCGSGYKIYYTEDCSNPLVGNSRTKEYTGPITITSKSYKDGSKDAISVIKAIAVKDGKSGQIQSGSYMLSKDFDSYAARYGVLPVFSISTAEENLFGETGIYTNFTVHGRETERQASVEYFDESGIRQIGMDAGIKIYGGSTRALPQKALKITARKEYGTAGKFKYEFFEDFKSESGNIIRSYDSIVLRAGGSDSLMTGGRSAYMRDPLVNLLANPISNITGMNAKPCVLYLNGKYWGMYFLRECVDDDYFESHYDTPKDNLNILYYGHENGNWLYKVDKGDYRTVHNFESVMNYIAFEDMSNTVRYIEATHLLDVDNFAKYFAINIYINNRDWPHNNMTAWRYAGNYIPGNEYTDGRWRFVLKDVDYTLGRDVNAEEHLSLEAESTAYFKMLTEGYGSITAKAFSSLLKNKEFKQLFVNILLDIANEYFSAETENGVQQYLRGAMYNEMPFHVTADFGGGISIKNTYGIERSSWTSRLGVLKNYAKKRPDVIFAAITDILDAGIPAQVTVKVIGGEGTFKVNTIEKFAGEGFTWSGTYMRKVNLPIEAYKKDGSRAKVTITSDNGKATYKGITVDFNRATELTVEIDFR